LSLLTFKRTAPVGQDQVRPIVRLVRLSLAWELGGKWQEVSQAIPYRRIYHVQLIIWYKRVIKPLSSRYYMEKVKYKIGNSRLLVRCDGSQQYPINYPPKRYQDFY
jgi:hypothetical protein